VRDLPHHLVASFRATLEEATHAHLLLIVLDVSDPAADLHYETVMRTLDELFRAPGGGRGADPTGRDPPGPPRLLILNKTDRLADNAGLLVWQQRVPESIALSAMQPAHPGLAALRDVVRRAAQGGVLELTLRVDLSDSRTVDTLEKRAEVLQRDYPEDDPGTVRMRVRIGRRQLDQLRSLGARMREEPSPV
jgi:GTP-binding protein HflX